MRSMRERLLMDRRVIVSEVSFVELVLWELPRVLPGSRHRFKYRLAFVVHGVCVLRYDNEAGKGDHVHYGTRERIYRFTDAEHLVADFFADVERWQDENRNA